MERTDTPAPRGELQARDRPAAAAAPTPAPRGEPNPRLRFRLRFIAGGLAAALVVLWVLLVGYVILEAEYRPAPAVFMLPIFFFSLAIWAGVAALKDEPIVMVLAGGLSFLPMGLILLFMPGFARWIAIIDLALIAIGVALLRSDPTAYESSPSHPSLGPPLMGQVPVEGGGEPALEVVTGLPSEPRLGA